MTQGDETETKQGIATSTDSAPRRRRHSHPKHKAKLTKNARNKIRTAAIVGLCALFIIVVWYVLISVPLP
jgi:hypothetical protein